MTTSGTIGSTVISTDKVVERAFRRCKLLPSLQTPDTVEIAQENLYLLLLSLSNRGLNLWCIDEQLMGLADAQAEYVLPTGTLQVLDLLLCEPTRATGTDTVGATSIITDLGDSTRIVRWGFKLSAGVTAAFTLASSTDGIAYTTRQTLVSAAKVADEWYWFDLDPTVDAQYWELSSATPFTTTEFYLASGVSETVLTQFSRSDYANQTNKYTRGRPSNFFFEKLVSPSITLWQVPNSDYYHLRLFRHRQVQDIGTLTQQIEVPQSWLDSIIWQLAVRLAFELPEVEADRRTELIAASEKFLIEAETAETDHGPIFITPGIGAYTA